MTGSDDREAPGGGRVMATGGFEVGAPPDEAIGWFTPEGERDWAPGWAPVYPQGEPAETPGTVFVTRADGVETIWVIVRIDRERATAEYVRVTPGQHAGTVAVHCAPLAAGRSRVSVAYDVSLLPGADPTALEPYRPPRFAASMRAWEAAVAELVAGTGDGGRLGSRGRGAERRQPGDGPQSR